nr:recombinase family protein [Acinetobacter sp. Marseille-Q1620]
MRIYAYSRIDYGSKEDLNEYIDYFSDHGYHVPKKRLLLEEVTVDTPIVYRSTIINLINYSLEENDLLIVKGLDSLGSCFSEIFELVNMINDKNVRLVCLEFSKDEIKGNLKKIFFHFIKMGLDFEKKYKNNKKNAAKSNVVRKVGRPEILDSTQKEEVLQKFKKGYSVYSLAKEYSVTRTVIQRVLNKASEKLSRGIESNT